MTTITVKTPQVRNEEMAFEFNMEMLMEQYGIRNNLLAD